MKTGCRNMVIKKNLIPNKLTNMVPQIYLLGKSVSQHRANHTKKIVYTLVMTIEEFPDFPIKPVADWQGCLLA